MQVLPGGAANSDEYSSLPPSSRIKVHEALLGHMDLIRSFVDENPAGLTGDDLGIVLSWEHLVRGKFVVFRELAKLHGFSLDRGIAGCVWRGGIGAAI